VRRFPWTLLHILIVGLMVGGAFATASLSSDAQKAESEPQSETLAAKQPQPVTRSEPSSTFSSLAPVNAPSPQQTDVEEAPLVLAEHMPPPQPCAQDPAHPTFCVYTVQSGDTLSAIAQTYAISGNEYLSAVEMLAQSNKPDVVSSDQIVPGQKLRLPKQTGIIHTVFSTRTLSEIVTLYGVSVEEVIAVPENGIDSDGHIQVGQDILIPNPRQLPPAVTPELPPIPEPTEEEASPLDEEAPETVVPPPPETPEVVDTPEPVDTEEPEPEETPEPVDEDEDVPPPVILSNLGDRPSEPSQYGFVWPVWGQISSYFGPSHPLGIDIDLYADPNAPIGAAKAGIVTFAGGNPCCSYGCYVIVEHGDGTSTLYGHLSQIAVTEGQVVTTGQLLGFGGATGYATGNHLHFEVRIGDNVVDPLIFLPEQ
jgi:murein DD-endopeptidase MepM/ murein hydrolase activator NlpD